MIAYAFHPGASLDLEQIREFIAEDSADAADRVVSDILASLNGLVLFPRQGTCLSRFDLASTTSYGCNPQNQGH